MQSTLHNGVLIALILGPGLIGMIVQALGSQLEEVRMELRDARQALAAAESSAQDELFKARTAFAQEKQAGLMHLEKLRETTLEQSTLRSQVAALERGAAALETSKAVEAETLRKQVLAHRQAPRPREAKVLLVGPEAPTHPARVSEFCACGG